MLSGGEGEGAGTGFIFLGESLSDLSSVSLSCRFNGLLLLLLRSRTSWGMGLRGGDLSAPAGGLSSLGGEGAGAGAGVKLNTGMASTLSCGADTGGQGGAGAG